jgi:hypothetical protein
MFSSLEKLLERCERMDDLVKQTEEIASPPKQNYQCSVL